MTSRSRRLRTALAAGVAAVLLFAIVRGQQEANEDTGKAAFERVCGGCHGPKGGGDAGPPLVPFTKGNRELLMIVREGNGQMPAISTRDISDDEVFAVADYLRSLGSKSERDRSD